MTALWYNYRSSNLIKATAAVLLTPRGHDTRKVLLMLSDHTPSAPILKTCYRCREPKPATTDYFSRDRSRGDGLDPKCKACKKELHAKNRGYFKERYLATREKYAEASRARAKAWRAANMERRIAKQKEYRQRNKAIIAESNRAYYLANKQASRAKRLLRIARKKNAPGTHTASDVKRQYKAQKGQCYYCKAPVGDAYQVDHVVPLSRGGSNGPENIVIACPFCNQSKGNKLPHEWAEGGRLL